MYCKDIKDILRLITEEFDPSACIHMDYCSIRLLITFFIEMEDIRNNKNNNTIPFKLLVNLKMMNNVINSILNNLFRNSQST